MLGVGLIVGQLTAGLRFEASAATHRERRSRALFEFARALSSVLMREQVIEVTEKTVAVEFRAKARIFALDMQDRLELPTPAADAFVDKAGIDLGTAQWALNHNEAAGLGTDTLAGSNWLYLPLKTPMRARGVLAVKPDDARLLLVPEQRQQLETFAALLAVALERVHYVEVAQSATLQMESERLRNSLLAAVSHDLRTPLAAIYGSSELLVQQTRELPAATVDLAQGIAAGARRMNAMVGNLLDMARLQSGSVQLNLQWQPLEEVVGSALQAVGGLMTRHRVVTAIAHDLPLLDFDAVLIERVFCNLLENAAKYTPAGSTVTISARLSDDDVVTTVEDDGPGLPPGREEALFEKFARGERESATPGVGLGLAICRAIVEAHGGRIWVDAGNGPREHRGARFHFTLPVGIPPEPPAPEFDYQGNLGDAA
jgi:two-component system sensor histidine kinase KdpD